MSNETETQTSSQQENNPPAWALPLFKTAAGDALKLYNRGRGGGTYNRPLVAPLSGMTRGGISAMYGAGDSWEGVDPQYLDQYVGTADLLQPIAQGDYLEGGNPYYKERLTQDIGEANDLIRASVSGMGRYGSDYLGETIADNTSDMMLRGLEEDWNRERGYQQDAIYGLGNIYGNANQMASDLAQQDFDNELTGARTQYAAGSILDAYNNARRADKARRVMGRRNAPWDRLAMLLGAATGSAGPYGTMTGTSTSESSTSNPLGAVSAIGGLMGK